MVPLPVCLAHADRPDIRNGLISCQPASLNSDFNLAQSRVQTSTWLNPDLNMVQSNSGMANPFRRSHYQMKRAKRFWIGCQLSQSKVQLNVIIWSQSLLLQQQRSSIIGQCFQLPRLKHQKRSRSWYDPQPGISVEQVIRGAGCYRYQNQKLCTFQRRTIIVRLKTSQRTWRIISCTGSM